MNKCFSDAVEAFCTGACDSVKRQASQEELGSYLSETFAAAIQASANHSQRQIKGLGRQPYIVSRVFYRPQDAAAFSAIIQDPEGEAWDQKNSNRATAICCASQSMMTLLPTFIDVAQDAHLSGKLSIGTFLFDVFKAVSEVKDGIKRLRPAIRDRVESIMSSVTDPDEQEKLQAAWGLLEKRRRRPQVQVVEVTCFDTEPEIGNTPFKQGQMLSQPEEDFDKIVDEYEEPPAPVEEEFKTYEPHLDLDGPTPMTLYPHPKHGLILVLVAVVGEVYVGRNGQTVARGEGVEQTIYKGCAIYDRDQDREITHKALDSLTVFDPIWYSDEAGTSHILKAIPASSGLIGKYWTNAKRRCPQCADLMPYNYYDSDKWVEPEGRCLKCDGFIPPTQENGDITDLKRWFFVRKRPDGSGLFLDIFENENKYRRLRDAIRRQKAGETQQAEAKASGKPSSKTTVLPAFVPKKRTNKSSGEISTGRP